MRQERMLALGIEGVLEIGSPASDLSPPSVGPLPQPMRPQRSGVVDPQDLELDRHVAEIGLEQQQLELPPDRLDDAGRRR
jgi:hypothetical protein